MKGLKVKEFGGVYWDIKNGNSESLDKLNEWIKNHDVIQISLSNFYAGYRGFILYKPDDDEK